MQGIGDFFRGSAAGFHAARSLRRLLPLAPLFIEPGVKTGMPVHYDNPAEVGADRIVNSVAAFEKFGGPCIVVDFGTATTFDVVSKKGEYLGGVITPGIGVSADALFERTARLPRVDIRKPPRVLATNTVNSLQSGLYYGYLGLIDGILERLIGEMGEDVDRGRDRRPRRADGRRLQIHSRGRRPADAGGPAHHLRAQPGPQQAARRTRPVNSDRWFGCGSNSQTKLRPRPQYAPAPFAWRIDFCIAIVENYFNYFTEIEEHFQRRRGLCC